MYTLRHMTDENFEVYEGDRVVCKATEIPDLYRLGEVVEVVKYPGDGTMCLGILLEGWTETRRYGYYTGQNARWELVPKIVEEDISEWL